MRRSGRNAASSPRSATAYPRRSSPNRVAERLVAVFRGASGHADLFLPQRRICLIRGEAIACDDNGLAVSDIEDNETIVSALKRASRCTFWRHWRLLAYDFRIRPANLLARASSFCEVVHRGGNLGVKELQTYPGHGGSYAFSLALRNTRCPCGFSYGRVKMFRDITDVRRQQKS
jgi:hypothetical protein